MPDGPLGLAEILDELDRAASVLVVTVGGDELEQARGDIDVLLSAIRAANQLLPDELKRPRGAFRLLQQHGQFINLYSNRGNLSYVRSNTFSLRADLVRLRAECAPRLADPDSRVPVNVEELSGGSAKNSLREALANFKVGAYNSSIVSAVNALEHYLRELRRRRMGIPPGRGRLIDVIEELEGGSHLSGADVSLLQVLRLYRNASAHPSEFGATVDNARMVIEFVFAMLKGS